MVAPRRDSVGVRLNKVLAILRAIRRFVDGLVPGLQSVLTAIGTRWSRKDWIGGSWVSRR